MTQAQDDYETGTSAENLEAGGTLWDTKRAASDKTEQDRMISLLRDGVILPDTRGAGRGHPALFSADKAVQLRAISAAVAMGFPARNLRNAAKWLHAVHFDRPVGKPFLDGWARVMDGIAKGDPWFFVLFPAVNGGSETGGVYDAATLPAAFTPPSSEVLAALSAVGLGNPRQKESAVVVSLTVVGAHVIAG